MKKSNRTSTSMVSLELPTDEALLQAAGRAALAHGQMEHILQMTVKTLTGLPLQEALEATESLKVYELREKIKKLFKQKSNDETAKTKLDALLNKAKKLSEKRNSLIHRPWAKDSTGQWLVKEDNYVWGPPPSADDLYQLAKAIHATAMELNTARLHGFIKEAVNGPRK